MSEEETKPHIQGQLDGLCGVYSIVNAINVLNLAKFDTEECFKVCLKAVPKLFPDAITEGTELKDLKKMLTAACKWTNKKYKDECPIEWLTPFKQGQFKTGKQWTDALDEFLDDYSVAIVGIEEPWMHWTVVWRTTDKKIKFFDSDGLNLVAKEKIKLGKAVEGRWVICPEETIIIRRIPEK